MGFLKRIFTGRKHVVENINGMPEIHEVTLSKILDVASLIPVEYRHTAKYYQDGFDPLTYERKRLEGLPADWLMQDKRTPAILADTHLEIEIAKRQYVNHIYSIQTIVDLQNGVIAHVDEMVPRLDKEISGYDKEIETLRAQLEA